MSALQRPLSAADDLAAELTDAAYQILLRHGLSRPFLDVELELWRELRAALGRGLPDRGAAWAPQLPLAEAV
jgi:hypothetical protein